MDHHEQEMRRETELSPLESEYLGRSLTVEIDSVIGIRDSFLHQ